VWAWELVCHLKEELSVKIIVICLCDTLAVVVFLSLWADLRIIPQIRPRPFTSIVLQFVIGAVQ